MKTKPSIKKRSASHIIEIDARGVTFYAQLDEAAFFWQLDNISCVLDYTLVSFMFSAKKMSRQNLWELLACCRRYKIDLAQFSILGRQKFDKWAKPWIKDVFERTGVKAAAK